MIARWLSIIFHPFVSRGVGESPESWSASPSTRQTIDQRPKTIDHRPERLAATTLALMRAPAGYVLLLVLPALIWSRLTLGRHSAPEVTLGTIIGAGAGAAIHFL